MVKAKLEFASKRGSWQEENQNRIPRHWQLAIRIDEELNKLLFGVTIAQSGVLPNIQTVLLPKKNEKSA